MSWSPRADRTWRKRALPEVVSICRRTWAAKYQNIVEEIASFALSRADGAAVKGTSDCQISFERIRLSDISVRNPERAEHAADGYPLLREFLVVHPKADAVPIVCSRSNGRIAVWDGHHRVRTYELAGREDIPAIVLEFVPGSGHVRVIPSRNGPKTS